MGRDPLWPQLLLAGHDSVTSKRNSRQSSVTGLFGPCTVFANIPLAEVSKGPARARMKGGCVCPVGRGLLPVLQGNVSLPPVGTGGMNLSSRVESGGPVTTACTLLLL